MSKKTIRLLTLLFFLSWRVLAAQTQLIWFDGQVEDYATHQSLSAIWQWADSARQIVIERNAQASGFAGFLPTQIRFLTLISSGYRTVQLPVHWPVFQTDSLSFRVRIPLVPIDKPTSNQPYFQSEQRPLTLAVAPPERIRIAVKFSVLDALTNRPVKAHLCLFFTRPHKHKCLEASALKTELVPPDLVAIEAKAAGYQLYLGNVVITDSAASYKIRLNPTPAILMIAIPGITSNLRLKTVRSEVSYELTDVDSSHFFVSAKPGFYQLTRMVKKQEIRDTLYLKEGLNAHAGSPLKTPGSLAQETIIYFAQSSYELSDSSKRQLDKIALLMKQNPHQKLRIIGHTDSVGNPQLNMTLSEYRAKTTKAYLLRRGIQASRFLLVAAGPDQPAVINDTEENRWQNRRVSLSILTF